LIAVRDKSTIPCFISMLNDSRTDLRALAASTLEDWTGKQFGFNPLGTLAERERVLEEIKQWWSSVKETFKIRPKSVNNGKQALKTNADITPPKVIAKSDEPVAAKLLKPVERVVIEKTAPVSDTIIIAEKRVEPSEIAPVVKTSKPKEVVTASSHVHHSELVKAKVPERVYKAPEKDVPKPDTADTVRTELNASRKKRSVKLDTGALGLN
jgi:hypothetical protein